MSCANVVSTLPRQVAVLWNGPQVLCDTVTDGGGWLVFQRRASAAVDFYRGWEDYKKGFGDLHGNFWLGNEYIAVLTSQHKYELRIDMEFEGKNYSAVYDSFAIGSEQERYKLKLGAYVAGSSSAPDCLSYHNGQFFTTWDRDGDPVASVNCAVKYHAPFWYNTCHRVNLNGNWGNTAYGMGLNWYSLTSFFKGVTFSEMKMRR